MQSRLIVFVLVWIVNSLTFFAAGKVAPEVVELGSWYIAKELAAPISGLLLTIATGLLEPVFKLFKIHIRHDLTWVLVFWVVNTEAIWLLGRLASYSGIGVRRFWVAVALGAVVNLLQVGVWKVARWKWIAD